MSNKIGIGVSDYLISDISGNLIQNLTNIQSDIFVRTESKCFIVLRHATDIDNLFRHILNTTENEYLVSRTVHDRDVFTVLELNEITTIFTTKLKTIREERICDGFTSYIVVFEVEK